MAKLVIDVPTEHRSMEELRPLLETALGQEFPGGLLQHRWEGPVLHVTGAGAKGTVTLEGGRLVGRAELAPPASLMQQIIEEKMIRALEVAASV